jgi:hypothetical protein
MIIIDPVVHLTTNGPVQPQADLRVETGRHDSGLRRAKMALVSILEFALFLN